MSSAERTGIYPQALKHPLAHAGPLPANANEKGVAGRGPVTSGLSAQRTLSRDE